MYQRNYPCDNIIDVYWGTQDLTPVGEASFKKQLYQCLSGSALEIKSDIEGRRATNEFGTVVWQLNEIWPTGGWGSLEYGTPVKGQVIGGRWKPVHYLYARSLFTDVTSTCWADNPPQCYVKNDGIKAFSGTVLISIVNFASGKMTTVSSNMVSLAPGAGTSHWFCAKNGANNQCTSWSDILALGNTTSPNEAILIISVSSGSTVVSKNEFALTTIHNMKLPKPNVTYLVSPNGQITLTTDQTAVYVTLTTQAQGRFSDNFFLMTPGRTTVSFIPFGPLDINTLTSTLRIEHAQLYQ
jgi:beta-galactosidase/beta-glucuronidase